MDFRPRLIALLPHVVLVALAPAAASAPATRPVVQPEADISQAIRDLGADEFHTRERATKQLWSAGARAEPALRQAAAGDDPEAATRARGVLRNIRLGLGPGTPPDVLKAVEEFDTADAGHKRELAGRLYDNPRTRPALAALWPRLWGQPGVNTALVEVASRAAAEALQALATDVAAAEVLLEIAMADGSDKSVRDYAAYLLVRAALPRAIARWQSESDAGVKAADRVLAYLHRANGDSASAAVAAGRCGDARLQRQMLVEAGDYPGLIRLAGASGAASADDRANLALWHRRAGDADAADRILAEDGSRPGRASAGRAAQALRHERVEAAVRELAAAGETAAAGEVLFARLWIDEALAVLDQPAAAAARETGLAPRVLKGTLLHRLGRRDEAARVWNETFDDALPSSLWHTCAAVVRGERAAGLQDAAAAHAVSLMNSVSAKHAQLEFAFTLDGGDAGFAWYEALRHVFPQDTAAETLKRHWAISERTLSRDEVASLAPKVAAATVERITAQDRVWWLEQVGHLLRDSGDYASADLQYSRMLYAHDSPRGMFHRADLALRRRQWARAADLFARAYAMDPQGQVHAQFLQGIALIEAGQKEEGQKRVELAGLQPLSSEQRRADLTNALDAHGQPERAAAQRTILVRSGAFDSPHVVAALGQEAARAEAAGDFARAAVLRDRLAAGEASTSPVALLTAAADAHRLRARAAIAAGDIDGAKREAARCIDLLPGNVDAAVSLVKAFERAGKKDEADLIFRRVSEKLADVAKSHPNAEFLRRDLAKLKSASGRE